MWPRRGVASLCVVFCWSLWLAEARAVGADASALQLFPGAPLGASRWPRFLFMFRASDDCLGWAQSIEADDVRTGMRLLELESVAQMLGHVNGSLSIQTAAAAEAGDAPGGTISNGEILDSAAAAAAMRNSSFLYVSLPSAEAAAHVAARCVCVRAAFDVWAAFGADGGRGSKKRPTAAEGGGSEQGSRGAEGVSDAAGGLELWRSFGAHLSELTPPSDLWRMVQPILNQSWRAFNHKHTLTTHSLPTH